MSGKILAHYSIRSGTRVSEKYAKSNPSKVESYTLDPKLLKKNEIAQDADGAASNLAGAQSGQRLAALAQKTRDTKNAARRAERALNKPGASATSVKKALKGKLIASDPGEEPPAEEAPEQEDPGENETSRSSKKQPGKVVSRRIPAQSKKASKKQPGKIVSRIITPSARV